MSLFNMLLAGGSYIAPPQNFYSANRRRTMMLLGDSITWGLGVLQYQTYAKAMQEKIDTVVGGGANTDEWVARNVQADDIVVSRDTGAPYNIPFKLQGAVSLSYDNLGPFSSTYSSQISATGPAILMNSQSDEFVVTPGSFSAGVIFITVMVKVTGSTGQSATIECPGRTPVLGGTVATVGGSNIGVNNIYRFIYQAPSSSTAFTIRRTDAAGGALARILSVNPTNNYPQATGPVVGNFATTGYINVQINARGSYVFQDYSDDMASIHESIIFPLSDPAGTLMADPVYVIALGTVSMYFNTVSAYPPTNPADRRRSPSEYLSDLQGLIDAIRAVAPNSPIVLTYPPVPNSASWFILTGFTRADYDSVIRSVSNSRRLPTVDLRTTLTNADYIDGIHPTVVGQGKLGTAYINALGL